jgi:glutathione S-transferase
MPYHHHHHPHQELLDRVGHFQVPYLEDANEGVYLFESAAIVQYLERTYATAAPAGASPSA